jgi:chromosome segregation ATPase
VKLTHLDLCGFRGFYKPLRINFPGGFTIITTPRQLAV